MRKKIFFLIAAAVALTVIFAACRKEYEDIVVESVSINQPTRTTLEVNDTLLLTASVLPVDAYNPTVNWTSSNTSVATVAVGTPGNVCIVTARSPGEVTIIVTTVEGGYTATYNLTVNMSGISLNKSTLSLPEGASETLTATLTPPNASNIIWTSSNNEVASVDSDGKVTAIKASTTPVTITATTQDGSKSATCTVNVTQANVPVTAVLLNESTMILTVNSTRKLTATIVPSNASIQGLTWNSSNNNVAEVASDGTVTAKVPGNATITVTTTDGSNKSATCAVVVTQANVPVTGITLDQDTLRFKIGDPSKTLIPTVIPPGATNDDVRWDSTDPSIATVNNGIVSLPTVAKTGETTIIASTFDGGFTAICIVIVEENYTPVTSVTLNANTLSLQGSNTGTLTAHVWPDTPSTNKSVIWSSSDSTVVIPTGNNGGSGLTGTITPEAPTGGITTPRTATITVTSVDDATKFASCLVTVTYVAIDASGVSLNKTATSLAKGLSETLEVIFTPAHASVKDVTWSSDNTSVAVVTNGIIFAVDSGTANITVTAVDGGETATCNVTVP